MKTYFFLLLVLFSKAFGQIEKSSLAFVISDTGSMGGVIKQVKNNVNLIFDTVMNSNASQIKSFVLVTFNDDYPNFRTKTQSREEFKKELDQIIEQGDGNCKEMSMEGIYRALIWSEPGSFIYVFTDASAKDAYKLADVQREAIEKNNSIFLTGRCTPKADDSVYQAYYTLAEATSGQVFHIEKENAKEMLNYIVVEQIKSPKTVITSKKFPPGPGHNLTIPVDSDMKTVIIAGSGDTPTIDVRSPDGSKSTKTVVDITNVYIILIEDPEPGNYTAVVGSKSETSVVVSASTSIKIQHGFSGIQVPNVEATSTTPISGEKTHLSIKLVTPDDDKVISLVELMDIKENVVSELPLILVNKKDKFYSTDGFQPPEHLFKVAVKGLDTKTNATFRRISPTPVEVQRPKLDSWLIDGMGPRINMVGGSKIIAEFNEPLRIACKVSGHPKPDVIWVDESNATFSSPVSNLKWPYDFVAVLEIEKVTKNSTYTCKASNFYRNDSESIKVETVPKKFFNIIEVPKDTTIEYKRSGNINCKVEAWPPAEITWVANDKEVHTNEYFNISSDGSVLTVKNMQVEFNGSYYCVAKNEDNLVKISFKILLSGFVNETQEQCQVSQVETSQALFVIMGAKEDSVHEITVECSKRPLTPHNHQMTDAPKALVKKTCLTKTKKHLNEDAITAIRLEILDIQRQQELVKSEKSKVLLDLDIEIKQILLENAKLDLELKKGPNYPF